jgi:hypothetical protein
MWEPSLPKTRPLYRAIVAALQRDINKGELRTDPRIIESDI